MTQIDKRIRKIISIIPNGKGKLLDIGCNDGTISILLKKKKYSVLGIDYDYDKLKLAKQKKINVKKVDIIKGLPFKNETFKVVFCGEVIEHILEPLKLIKEIYRVLKKNGILYLSTPNISSLRNAILILFGSFPAYASRYNSEHIRDYNQKDVSYLLSKAGFKNIKFYGNKISIPIGKMKSIELPPYITHYSDYLIASCIK